MSKDLATNIQKTVASLVKDVILRNRDIISRRFGLKNGKKETLESIGHGYGITRERVRQIEEFALKQLSKFAEGNPDVAGYITWAENFINSEGGVVKEKDLFKAFSGQESDSPANSSLVFLLSVSGGLVRSLENDGFFAFWASDNQKFNSFKNTAAEFIKALERNGNVILSEELDSFARKNSIDNVKMCLSVSKSVNKNIFGQVGLVSWPEVKPRGVRDKAYMVLKRANSPKHFGDIARLINEVGFSNGDPASQRGAGPRFSGVSVGSLSRHKKANVQTVHNELIKDQRFVLVGRGIYALSEWGYTAGTVKDVLVDVLKRSQKPMAKALLVAKVKDMRMVKENTILLNLQDSKTFSKREDGTYTLRKA